MENVCLNCNNGIADNFCSSCGQKKYKRIDKKYVLDEMQYMVLHTNKGFLYSVKNLIKNPGKTARDFVEGNRVNHYKPLLLTFVLSGFSALISYKVIGLSHIMEEYYSETHRNSAFIEDYASFTSSYNSFIMLLMVPFFSIFTKLAFRKWGQNYFEHVIMNAYILSLYTLLNIVLIYPLMYFMKDQATAIMNISYLSILCIIPLMIWFYRNFYSEKPLSSIIGKVALTLLLVFLGFLVMLILIMILIFVIALIKGPEALQYIQPK